MSCRTENEKNCPPMSRTVVRSVWKRGRPARPRLLRPCNRARREWFCVLPNGVAFRATFLAQQARRLKMPLQIWGPQTSSMALPRRHTATGYKQCSPLLRRMSSVPSLARMLQLMQMACGRLGRSSAFIRALRPP